MFQGVFVSLNSESVRKVNGESKGVLQRLHGVLESLADFHVNFRQFQGVSKVPQGVSGSFRGLRRFSGECQEVSRGVYRCFKAFRMVSVEVSTGWFQWVCRGV